MPNGPSNRAPVQLAHGQPVTTAPVPRIGLSLAEAAAAIGLGESTLRDLIAAGRIRPSRVGRRLILSVVALQRLLDELAEDGSQADQTTDDGGSQS